MADSMDGILLPSAESSLPQGGQEVELFDGGRSDNGFNNGLLSSSSSCGLQEEGEDASSGGKVDYHPYSHPQHRQRQNCQDDNEDDHRNEWRGSLNLSQYLLRQESASGSPHQVQEEKENEKETGKSGSGKFFFLSTTENDDDETGDKENVGNSDSNDADKHVNHVNLPCLMETGSSRGGSSTAMQSRGRDAPPSSVGRSSSSGSGKLKLSTSVSSPSGLGNARRKPGVILLGRGNSFSLGRSEVMVLHHPLRRRIGEERQGGGGGGVGAGRSSSNTNSNRGTRTGSRHHGGSWGNDEEEDEHGRPLKHLHAIEEGRNGSGSGVLVEKSSRQVKHDDGEEDNNDNRVDTEMGSSSSSSNGGGDGDRPFYHHHHHHPSSSVPSPSPPPISNGSLRHPSENYRSSGSGMPVVMLKNGISTSGCNDSGRGRSGSVEIPQDQDVSVVHLAPCYDDKDRWDRLWISAEAVMARTNCRVRKVLEEFGIGQPGGGGGGDEEEKDKEEEEDKEEEGYWDEEQEEEEERKREEEEMWQALQDNFHVVNR